MKIKRVIPLIVFVGIILATMIIGGGLEGLSSFIDYPSVLVVLSIDLAMLLFADMWGDFHRGFKIAMGDVEYTVKELKTSYTALSLGITTNYFAGIVGTLIGGVNLMRNLSDPKVIGPSIAVAVLTILYGMLINLILYPIRAKVKKEMIYKES